MRSEINPNISTGFNNLLSHAYIQFKSKIHTHKLNAKHIATHALKSKKLWTTN